MCQDNYHGTIVNAQYSPVYGGVMSFDGYTSSGRINIPLYTSDGIDHTFEIWAKKTPNTFRSYWWGGGFGYMRTELNNYDYSWGYYTGFNDNNSYEEWHQLVAMAPNPVAPNYISKVLYLNGEFKSSSTSSFGIGIGSNFALGIQPGTNYDPWNGYISIFRIYNRILEPDEIQQNYLATKGRYGL
jgi:hypothetical protein